MQQAFMKMFSTGDSSQTAALIIILGITFLLGILVWALLAHLPSSRKLKKRSKELKVENDDLKKGNTDLTERNTVANAKLSRSTEDLQTAEANLKEKTEKVESLSSENKILSQDLSKYKKSTQSFKESYQKLLEQYNLLSEEHNKVSEKMEGMRSFVGEVELQRVSWVLKHEEQETSLIENEKKLNQVSDSLNKAEETAFLLKKDLEAALAQRAELRKMLNNIEEVKDLISNEDTDFATEIIALKEQVQSLEEENTELMCKVAPYLAKEEEERKEEEELEKLLVNLLVEAEESMNKGVFYSETTDNEFVSDSEQLQKSLSELVEQEPIEHRAAVQLTENDHKRLDKALEIAANAMSLQGFYGDIEEAVLVQHEATNLTDDELMDKYLEDVIENVENTFFFNEDSTEEGFVTDSEFLETQLAAIQEQEQSVEEQKTYLEDTDHEYLDAALEAALAALGEEGLYEPISSEKLIGSFENKDSLEYYKKYQSELEEQLMQEISLLGSAVSEKDKENLKKIDGIGLFVEQRLNDLGIYTYQQISLFDSAFITKLSLVLGFSEQTIVRDGWVEQAKELLSN